MAYKFQMTDAILSGTMAPSNDDAFDLGVSGAKWKDLYIDGTAYLDAINYNGTLVTATAAELNYLDNDALTAADITKLAALTATAAEINYLDNDDLSAADLQKLADITSTAAELNLLDTSVAATVVNSKAVIYGAAGQVNGTSLSASTGITGSSLQVGAYGLTNAGQLAISSFNANWTNAGKTVADLGTVTTVDINGGTADAVVIGGASAAAGTFTVLTANTSIMPDANDGAVLGAAGTAFSDLFLAEGGVINWDSGDMTMTQAGNVLTVAGGTLTATLTNALAKAGNSGLAMTSYDGSAAVSDLAVDLDDLAAAAVSVAADSIAFIDATDDSTKKESIADFVTAMAGVGLVAGSGELALDINELTAATIDVASDSFAIVDANDSNVSKKESIADFIAAIAGTGLTATNGVLSSDASPTPNNIGDAAASMVEGFNYSSAVFSAVRTWTCPASPDAGDKVVVKAPSNASTYALTVLRAGSQTIDGQTSVVLSSDNGAITLTYLGSDKWAIS